MNITTKRFVASLSIGIRFHDVIVFKNNGFQNLKSGVSSQSAFILKCNLNKNKYCASFVFF